MFKNKYLLVIANIVLLASVSFGQEPAEGKRTNTKSSVANFADLLPSGVGDMLQVATEVRKASESLERFGKSASGISTAAAEAAATTSQNLAAIGGEFDPFGFKTAFKTIQQQNAIIQAQHQVIMDLQQQEIRRLRRELTALKRSPQPNRRRRSSADRKPRRQVPDSSPK